MSSSYEGNPPQNLRPGFGANSGAEGGVFDKLDAFVSAARHLEGTLAQERSRYRKLQEEMLERQASHERNIKELEIRNRELSIKETRLEAALDEFRDNESRLTKQTQQLALEAKKLKEELTQYKTAWAEVLQREREAKMILAESQNTNKRIQDLERRLNEATTTVTTERAEREQAERHSKSYQLELKNALVRLHSAEAKFSELSKELQAFRQSKMSLNDEIAKVEKSLRERLEWESIKEREKIKAELGREMALEREAFRAQILEQTR